MEATRVLSRNFKDIFFFLRMPPLRIVKLSVGLGGICNSTPISKPICNWLFYLTPALSSRRGSLSSSILKESAPFYTEFRLEKLKSENQGPLGLVKG